MPIVDRNILRLGTYELMFSLSTPPKVAINEAIELAKKYSTENSATFVNGVLDRIYTLYASPLRKPSDQPEAEPICRLSLLPTDGFWPDPLKRVDLHIHSNASDGSLEPEELVTRAVKAGLAAIAIADHDIVDGVERAVRAAQGTGLIVVPAVELTAYIKGDRPDQYYEMHLIGMFVEASDPDFVAELKRLQRIRVERVEKIGEKLRGMGLSFDSAEVLRRAGAGSVGRVHVAMEMVRQGACASIREAFDGYIGADKPAYVPKERLTPAQAIRLIHDAGGAAVLAHPGFSDRIADMLEELQEAGLDGIEVHYPGHSPADEARWLDAARELDLAVSGGSDFHGEAKPETDIGQETVSMIEVCELLDRANGWRTLAALTAE